MISIRAATAVAVWLAVCALMVACGPQSSPKPSSESPGPPIISPSPATSGRPAADPDQAFLTIDQVNAIVAKTDPTARALFSPDPVAHQPESPRESLVAPCGQVLPLYFGAGEPRFSSYALWTAAGETNVFVWQLVVQYASAAQATTKFARLSKDVPACADAAAANPDSGLALRVGEITSDSVQFEKTVAGANRQLPDWHVVNNEYRLLGNSIMAVSATEPAAIVATIADQLGNRLGGR